MEGMDKNVNPDKVLEELTEQVRKVCEKQNNELYYWSG